MIDETGLEDLGDIAMIGMPWHGLVRRVKLAVKRIVLGSVVGQTRDIIPGDVLVGSTGQTATVIDADWPVMRCEVTGGFSGGEIVSVGGAIEAATITLIENAENPEYRIVTDNGSIDRRLLIGQYDSSAFRSDALAWKFQRPGIADAPAASEAEDALGMEWRNFVLAPSEFGWQAGQNINPVVDDAGNVWLIANMQGSTESDRSGFISLSVIPQSYLVINESSVEYEPCVTVFPPGTVPPGINNLGGVATWRLTAIKDNGRLWLYCIEGGNLPPGHLGGIVEVRISGIGVYDPGQPAGERFSGLVASIVVRRTYEECRPQISVAKDDQISYITPIHCDPEVLGDASNRQMLESLVCDRDITQTMIISAWYDAAGNLVYPRLQIRHQTQSSAFATYYYYGYCNYGNYQLINVHSYNLNANANIRRTYKLEINGSYTAPIEHLHTVVQTHSGAANNSGSGTGEDRNFINGEEVSVSNYIGSFSPGVLNIPGLAEWLHICQGSPFENGEEFGITLFASGTTTYVDSDVDYSIAHCCLASIGVKRDAANVLRLVYAKSVDSEYAISDFNTWPAYDLEVSSGHIAGYASPNGVSAGAPIASINGSYGRFSGASTGVGVVHLAELHPMYSAWNPHTHQLCAGSTVPVIFI